MVKVFKSTKFNLIILSVHTFTIIILKFLNLNSYEDSYYFIGSEQKDPDFISDNSAQLAF